jgi:hypothetical protein
MQNVTNLVSLPFKYRGIQIEGYGAFGMLNINTELHVS